MWILYGGILSGLLCLFVFTSGVSVEADWHPEGIYRVFLRSAIWIQRKRKTVTDKEQYRCRTEKISAFLFCMAAGAVVALLVLSSAHAERRLDEEGRIRRNTYGEGSVMMELEAQYGKEKEILQIEIEEEKLTEEELEQILPEMRSILMDELRAENNSLDRVISDLSFPMEVDGYPFSIRWESGNYGRVGSDGRIKTEDIPEEGEVVTLTAELSYGDFVWLEQFQVRICRESRIDNFSDQLRESVEQYEKDAEYEESFFLPTEIRGKKIIWKERIKDYSSLIFLIFLIIGAVQIFLPDQEAEKRVEEKRRKLRLAYPEFVSKLTLLMGTGLPVRSALFRMAADYETKKREGKSSPLYEEIILLCREMNSGVTEMQAYENFGNRCCLTEYRKCAALLRASQQKGTSGLLETLREEAENSFRERKHLAKEEGERTGTRLLFPMMMTLSVVMMLILIPAYFSFAGM